MRTGPTTGPAKLIELWIEDCLLIEVATPQMEAAYKKLATLSDVRSMVQPAASLDA